MIRYALGLWLVLLSLNMLPGQKPALETASNFVNFNLNRINMVRSYLPEYNGQGMVVSVKEFQYDSLDIDFSGRHIPHSRSAGQTSAHSTLMATIIAGGGNSFLTGKGVAWAAQLTSSSFFDIFPDENTYFEELGIGVQNHSYGIDSIENFYGPVAGAYDLQSSQLPQLLHVFSIGNLGDETPTEGPYAGIAGFANMSGEFKTAKNVLTMGVIDSFGIIDPFSSRGPTFDGRIKPELVAFGINGSSGGAALASGAALLLQQAYWEEAGQLPPAALVKGLLINGARDLGTTGVDYTYGFGSIDSYRSLRTLLAGRFQSDTIAFDQQKSYTISLPQNVETLRITLTWTDPPAEIGTDQALVNDIDLTLIRSADGQQFFPQRLSAFPHPDSLRRPASSGPDHLNNVEQVVLHRPLSGDYELKVEAFDFQVTDQAFHLVYDWDTVHQFQWLFPTRGNQIVQRNNFLEQLYWDAGGATTTGNLSYSIDGTTWHPIEPDVNLSRGTLAWFPPDTLARAQLRMDIGASSFVSDTFTLAPRPTLQVVLNCADSVGVSWNPVPGVQQYRFFRLGEKYMEPYFETSDTFAIIQKAELTQPFIAYAPLLKDGEAAVRSLAYNLDQLGTNCYAQFFSGEIIGIDAYLSLVLGTLYRVRAVELERMIDGQFAARTHIDFLPRNEIEFTDTDLDQGPNFFRAKIILTDGSSVYSNVVRLDYIPPDQFLIFPNPVDRRGNFQVLSNSPEPGKVLFQVYTATGARVFSLSLIELNAVLAAEDFPSGLYFYRFIRGGIILQSGKLVVR